MKYRFLTIFILFAVLLSSIDNTAKAEDSIPSILEGILNRYGNLPGLSLPYKREIITKSMAMLGDGIKTDQAAGKIYFTSPYFLSVRQERPMPETLTTDGDKLWWYIPHKNLVYQYPAERAGKELRLLSDIFQGLGRVEESFDVVQSDLGSDSDYHLKLIPNPPWEEINYINLAVTREEYKIRVVEIHNFMGSITRFILGDLSVEKDLKEAFFRPVIPDGVKVIKEGE